MNCERCGGLPTRWVWVNRLQASLCPPCERAWGKHVQELAERALLEWLGKTPANGVRFR